MTTTRVTGTTIEPTVDRIRREGWCVIEDVIPGSDLPRIRDDVWSEIRRQRGDWEREVAKIIAAGHQPPPRMVSHAQALINDVPQISPYIADPRILSRQVKRVKEKRSHRRDAPRVAPDVATP